MLQYTTQDTNHVLADCRHQKRKSDFPSINRWLMEIKHRRDSGLDARFRPECYVFIVREHLSELIRVGLETTPLVYNNRKQIYFFVHDTDVKFPANDELKNGPLIESHSSVRISGFSFKSTFKRTR